MRQSALRGQGVNYTDTLGRSGCSVGARRSSELQPKAQFGPVKKTDRLEGSTLDHGAVPASAAGGSGLHRNELWAHGFGLHARPDQSAMTATTPGAGGRNTCE